MRYDEEQCRCAVDLFLREQGFQPEWIDGTEPPDYFLRVGNRTFAVEMTSIHGFTNFDGDDHSWAQIEKELLSFGDDVCREVESAGVVSGCYKLYLPPMPNLKQWRQELVQRLVTYFKQNTSQTVEKTTQVVLQSEGRDVTVWKVRKEGSALSPLALLAGALTTRSEDQLTDLLTAAIQTKTRKLYAVTKPWILVILDQYGFQRSIEEWRTRLPVEASNFGAVIRVRRNEAELVSGNFCIS